jgi:hypothetical protein
MALPKSLDAVEATPRVRLDGSEALETAYVGIDVACAKKKALPISVCVRQDSKLIPLPLKTAQLKPPRGGGNVLALEPTWRSAFAAQAESYLRGIEEVFSVQIERVAIDAPSEPCRVNTARREAERARRAPYKLLYDTFQNSV